MMQQPFIVNSGYYPRIYLSQKKDTKQLQCEVQGEGGGYHPTRIHMAL